MIHVDAGRENLSLAITTENITQLSDPTWRQTTIHGWLGDIDSLQFRTESLRIPTVLSDPEAEPVSDQMIMLSIDSRDNMKLAIDGWHLLRCMTDLVTVLDIEHTTRVEQVERFHKIGIGRVRITSLDWLSSWVALCATEHSKKI